MLVCISGTELLRLRYQHAGVYLRDGAAETGVRAATLREMLLIKLSISPSIDITDQTFYLAQYRYY